MIGQVDKHMQTLVKKMRDIVAKTEDPRQIEHTMKQIQKIEKLHSDAKRAIKSNQAHQLIVSESELSCGGVLDSGPTKRIKVLQTDDSMRTVGKSTFMSTDCDDLLNVSVAHNE